MGCASGKPSSKKDKEESPPEIKAQNSQPREVEHYKYINIEAQQPEAATFPKESERHAKDSARQISDIIPAKENRASTITAPNKENKDELTRKQLLKKYDIKVNNNSQRVLPVNSYRYDILLPHNPQIAEAQPQNVLPTVGGRE